MSDTSTSELHELDAKISKARAIVRDATRSASESTGLTTLEVERSAMLAELERKRLAELAAQSSDLPGAWTWTDDGEAVDADGEAPVYIDGDGDVCFEEDDGNSYRPIEVVRAVLARHDAAESD